MKIENFIQVEKWVSKQDHHTRAGLKKVLGSYSDSGSDERYSFTRP